MYTGIGFFDHMLNSFATHAGFGLELEVKGDLYVDEHHTVEDTGIALGKAFYEALGDKSRIERYGAFSIPMDEALAQIALDFSGRPFLVWNADIPRVMLGNMEAEMLEEFFRAVAMESALTLHVNLLYGKNTHHMAEAIFKGFARALAEAVAIDPRVQGVMSSKGTL